jgi:hypothetical protein
MRTSLTAVGLSAALLYGISCGPEPVTPALAVNIQVSAEWEANVDSVKLVFAGGDVSCTEIENTMVGNLSVLVGCSVYGDTIPSGVTCRESEQDIARDPGADGTEIHLAVGEYQMIGYALDSGGSELDRDCVQFDIQEGKITEVTLNL